MARLARILLLALIPTVLTAVQPLSTDDPTYYELARQVPMHPLDPYGGGRIHTLSPPALLYWGAGTTALVGDSIPLAKLALFPFALLLVLGLDALARRFTPALNQFVVAMAMLSPWVLPGFNYMLDVPAYGLGLAALGLFVSGCDRRLRGRVLLGGLLAGLAMQTKYNLATIPAAMVVYGVTIGRGRDGWLAGLTAAALFIGVEWLITAASGQSLFLFQLHGRAGLGRAGNLAYGVIAHAGGLGAALIPIGLLALNVSPWRAVAALVACAATLAAIGTGHDAAIATVIGVPAAALPTVAHLSGLLGLALIAVKEVLAA